MAARKASFTTTPVVGGGTFVEGTDVTGATGSTILFDETWSAYQESLKLEAATEEYDAVVKAFFAPLVEAAEAVKTPEKKDWSTIVVSEPVEGKRGIGVKFGPEGVILRIIAETDGSSLRWVNGRLIALEV